MGLCPALCLPCSTKRQHASYTLPLCLRVLSRPACLPVCAPVTQLFLQVQRVLLHCAAAQPFNQAVFLFQGGGVTEKPSATY